MTSDNNNFLTKEEALDILTSPTLSSDLPKPLVSIKPIIDYLQAVGLGDEHCCVCFQTTYENLEALAVAIRILEEYEITKDK